MWYVRRMVVWYLRRVVGSVARSDNVRKWASGQLLLAVRYHPQILLAVRYHRQILFALGCNPQILFFSGTIIHLTYQQIFLAAKYCSGQLLLPIRYYPQTQWKVFIDGWKSFSIKKILWIYVEQFYGSFPSWGCGNGSWCFSPGLFRPAESAPLQGQQRCNIKTWLFCQFWNQIIVKDLQASINNTTHAFQCIYGGL